jgi:uncharacterized protein
MSTGLLQNLIDPAILFFVFGVFAGAVRSNLEIPPAIAKFFSLFLLISLGLKGGASLASTGLSSQGALALLAAVVMATAVPAYSFLLLRRRINPFDAAAVAATYGSVSAVTFVTAQNFLVRNQVDFGGHMTVALVVMESPAIIMAVLLASMVRRQSALAAQAPGGAALPALSLKKVLHEALTDGTHMVLIGSLVIGWVTGADGKKIMDPFFGALFKGVLAFFLLEMGLLVARQLREARESRDPRGALGRVTVAFALGMPLVNATLAMLLASAFGLARGDAFLIMVLAASGSYIAVPAIVRYAIPEARVGVYFTMSLGFTFPLNIVFGIPLYFAVVNRLWN